MSKVDRRKMPMFVPSGLNAASHTPLRCPSRESYCTRPVAGIPNLNGLIVTTGGQTASHPGLHATQVTRWPECPWKVRIRLAGFDIPHFDSAIPTRRCKLPAVRTPRDSDRFLANDRSNRRVSALSVPGLQMSNCSHPSRPLRCACRQAPRLTSMTPTDGVQRCQFAMTQTVKIIPLPVPRRSGSTLIKSDPLPRAGAIRSPDRFRWATMPHVRARFIWSK